MKERNKINQTLLDDRHGEDVNQDDEAISVNRLEQLLEKVSLEPTTRKGELSDTYEELTDEEKKDFDAFLKQKAAGMLEIWEPWWNYRQTFATKAIEELDANSDIDYNLNRFGQENLIAEEEAEEEIKEESDDGNGDFEDINNEDEEETEVDMNDESDH